MKHFKIFIPFSLLFFVSLTSLSDHSQLLLPAPRECAALLSSHSRQSVTMGVGVRSSLYVSFLLLSPPRYCPLSAM